ncbi:MAG: replication-relaxation family protein [Actinomycetota bacterium]|nr:replication-relaxation family protein [Actinomycetota bacterium]MDA8358355.1 replication-relaxation family protein [Actinomycetota bacterium]
MDVASSLTDRDRHILRLLRWHRVLTTSQIHVMVFSDRNTAQHRMTRLHELRLVERFRPLRAGRDSEYHYVLDVLGAYVVAAMANRDPAREPKMRWRTDWALSIATSQRLAHTVGANDLFVRLVAAARTRPDAELSTWWGERYCTDRLGEVVRPDGLGVWREGEATVAFCLEYDRGSEQLSRLTKKAGDYARLEAAWGVAFWLVVVVPGPRREAGARLALSGQGLAVATTMQAMALRPTEGIWAPLGADGTRAHLAELAGWPRPAESLARLARAARRPQGADRYEEAS